MARAGPGAHGRRGSACSRRNATPLRWGKMTPPALKRRTHYRKLKSDFMVGLTIAATVIALTPLFLVLGYLASQGASSVTWDFFTKMPVPVGQAGGGMANPIDGTPELVGLAGLTCVAIRVGGGMY